MEIKVTKRYKDYHACIKSDARYWGCGRSPAEAIGDLIRSHSEKFAIQIDREHERRDGAGGQA